jgi:hypothetical protein
MDPRNARDRRRFLVLSGLVLAAWPGSAAGTGAQDRPAGEPKPPPKITAVELAAAWKRAQASTRPLLVMLVQPEPEGLARGMQWGQFLELAPESARAELELCELALATATQVRELWPELALSAEALPHGLLFVPGEARAHTIVLEAGLAAWPDPWVPRESAALKACHAALAKALHAAIAPDEATFEQRARLALGAEAAPRATVEKELARRLRTRLWTTAPAGARWGYRTPDADASNDPVLPQCMTGPCGTGHMSVPSYRFLRLYVEPRVR